MAMDDASGPGRRPSVPSLAVVVPSFNHARYIGEALRSIFAQDYPRLEVRVIDDGSADGSPAAIARAFEEAGGVPCRLTVRPNRGCSATLNELIEGVDADYVAILNSDDLYMPGRLTRLLAGASPSGPYFAFSGVSFLGEDGAGDLESWHEWYATILAQARALPTAGFALLRMNFSVSSSNFVFSRGLFDAVGGFDERLPLSQDWDFILRALRFVEPVLIPDRLLTYRVHATNTYRDHQATRVAEIEAVFRKFAGWAGLPSANAVAPTPLRWPHFFRTFVHVCTGACRRPLAALLPPELTARGPVDGPATGREREALRRLMHAATSPEGAVHPDVPSLLAGCAPAWGPPGESSARVGPVDGVMTWGRFTLRISVPDRTLLEMIAEFTGLEVAADSCDGTAALVVEDDRHVRVGADDRRSFGSFDDMAAWLALTVSDVLISRGRLTVVHASAFSHGGRSLLVCGPPRSGKSTVAVHARRRGLDVIADDLVWFARDSGTIRACPRPLKTRVVPGVPPDPDATTRAIRTRLDGEDVLIHPRRAPRIAPLDRDFAVDEVIHIRRRPGPGADLEPMSRLETLQALVGQVRSYDPRPLAEVAATAASLARLPNRRLVVGDGQLDAAFDRLLARRPPRSA